MATNIEVETLKQSNFQRWNLAILAPIHFQHFLNFVQYRRNLAKTFSLQ